ERMKGYLVDSYKGIAAPNPTMLIARDALLSAILAGGNLEDWTSCAAGFGKRGAGLDAVGPDSGSATHTGVRESFTPPSFVLLDDAELSSTGTADCDADGLLDPGESGTLTLS